MARVSQFNARWVQSISTPATGRQEDYFEGRHPNLGLRVTENGHKSWCIMYRHGGRLRRLTLGKYPDLTLADARRLAAAVRHQVALGKDPASRKRESREAMTFSALTEDFVERYAKRRYKNPTKAERILKRHVLPHWEKRLAKEISRRDVIDLLDGVVRHGAAVQSNRVLSLIRKVFNWAIEADLIEYNPCTQIRPPTKEHARDRVLSESEIQRIWTAFEHLVAQSRRLLSLQLLTGQRGGEIRQMAWDDIDFSTAWWTIPASVSKNGLAHRVPLSPPVISILHDIQSGRVESRWVFPSPRNTNIPLNHVTLQRAVARIREVTGIEFKGHDFRRTVASHLTSQGFPRFTVARILNHVERDITGVYDRHSYDPEKRQALKAWSQKVLELVTNP